MGEYVYRYFQKYPIPFLHTIQESVGAGLPEQTCALSANSCKIAISVYILLPLLTDVKSWWSQEVLNKSFFESIR